MPLPVKCAIVGLNGEFEATDTSAVRGPGTLGINVVLTGQVPGPDTVPQSAVWPKSPGKLPVSVIPEICTAPGPGFVNVVVCDGVRVPSVVSVKKSCGGTIVGNEATVANVLPVIPVKVAEIVAVPRETPVTCPWLPAALLTVATPIVSEAHVEAAVRSCIEPSLKFPWANSCTT